MALPSLLVGCMPPKRASLDHLRVRAAFDLACPQQMVSLHYIDPRTRGVVGCGRRLAYLESCDDAGAEAVCTWQRDGQPPDATAAVAAATMPAGVAGSVVGTPGPSTMGLVCTVVPVAPAAPPSAPAQPVADPTPEDAPDTRDYGPPDAGPPSVAPRPLDPFEDRH
ncbi:MAG: hypothetical protein JRI55_36270 [Deltaproteobacteria bacterium]|nr:hypothetical protein [Deltaproteobacteria bacterium]